MNDIYPLIAFWCSPRTAMNLKIASKTTNLCITPKDIDRCFWRNYVCNTISEKFLIRCAIKGHRSDLIQQCVQQTKKDRWNSTYREILEYIFTYDQVNIFLSWKGSHLFYILDPWWILAVKNKCVNILRIKFNTSIYGQHRVIILLKTYNDLDGIRWLLENDLVSKMKICDITYDKFAENFADC